MSNAETLRALLSMKCEGFSGYVSLHIDSQAHFDLIVAALPEASVYTKPTDSGVYSVAKVRGGGGMDITLFGPEQAVGLRLVRDEGKAVGP